MATETNILNDGVKMTYGNYMDNTVTGSFPLDCETFSYITNNIFMANILGNICGNGAILYGCKSSGGYRSSGYLFLKTTDFPQGEVIYFDGGTTGGLIENGFHVEVESVDVTADGVTYSNAYTRRVLKEGDGTDWHMWDEFIVDLSSNYTVDLDVTEHSILPSGYKWDLEGIYQMILDFVHYVDTLDKVPVGSIIMWAGSPDSIPDGYKLCNGDTVDRYTDSNQTTETDIYKALSPNASKLNSYTNYAGTTVSAPASNKIRVPDLRSRFVVGYNSGNTDYNTIGYLGGAASVTLTANQSGLPLHSHVFKDYYYIEAASMNGVTHYDSLPSGYNNNTGSASSDTDNTQLYYYSHTTNTTGGYSASVGHENRPPYYVLSFIIKVE